jgi:anti-sigma factor RsiW
LAHVRIGTKRYDSSVEPERFDDVEFRILESPEPRPRRPRRRRRWALALVISGLMVGGLAAGASALTGGSDEKAPAATPRQFHGAESGVTFTRQGKPCHHGGGHRAPAPSSGDDFRY